jgi:hypothetical protein
VANIGDLEPFATFWMDWQLRNRNETTGWLSAITIQNDGIYASSWAGRSLEGKHRPILTLR